MTLTKNDLQAIGTAIRPVVKEEISTAIEKQVRPMIQEEISTAEKRIVAEMGKRFTEQNEHLSKTAKATLEEVYNHHPTREEFEEALDRIHELEERMKRLEEAHHTTS
jgi:polyhydroxyalkanoate synthesis regulator phasin